MAPAAGDRSSATKEAATPLLATASALSPRAASLLGGAGLPGAFPCIAAGANGDAGTAAPSERILRSCQARLTKSGGKLASARVTETERCVTALIGCQSLRESGGFPTPDADAACAERATATCTRSLAKIATLAARTRTDMSKGCSALLATELKSALGFSGLVPVCGGLTTNEAIVDCVIGQISCSADRAAELLGAADLLDGFTCLAP